MKLCPTCKIPKPITEFYSDPTKKGGISHECKECKRRRERERHSCTKYGYFITHEDYCRLLTAQTSGCAICRYTPCVDNEKRLAVDHDHSTGLVRGLLCQHCNLALGLLKDNLTFAVAAMNYLLHNGESKNDT